MPESASLNRGIFVPNGVSLVDPEKLVERIRTGRLPN